VESILFWEYHNALVSVNFFNNEFDRTCSISILTHQLINSAFLERTKSFMPCAAAQLFFFSYFGIQIFDISQ